MRILIAEDDPFVALDLESIILDIPGVEVRVVGSLAEARCELDGPIDFAFLDIELRDGRVFEVAHALRVRRVPFAFVTASDRREVPAALDDAPFIAKPFKVWQIERSLLDQAARVAAQ